MSMKSVKEREVELIYIISKKMTSQSLLEYNPDKQSGICPCCGQRLNMPIKRCTNCGQAVKWE